MIYTVFGSKVEILCIDKENETAVIKYEDGSCKKTYTRLLKADNELVKKGEH